MMFGIQILVVTPVVDWAKDQTWIIVKSAPGVLRYGWLTNGRAYIYESHFRNLTIPRKEPFVHELSRWIEGNYPATGQPRS